MNLRIAIVSRSLPKPGSGGMEQVVAGLISAWQGSGASVTVVTAEKPAAEREPASAPVIVVPGAAHRTSARWTQKVARSINWADFDIVFGVSAAARGVAYLHDRPPVVMQAHGTSFDEIRTKLRLFTPRSLASVARNVVWAARDLLDTRRYDTVVAVGPGVARTLARYPLSLRARRLEVISNGVPVDAESTPSSNAVDYDYDYLYVGRLHREKGVDLLVRAVRTTELRLAIVGDGPDRDRLRRLATGAPNIVFLGRSTPDSVKQIRRRSRAAVMPSRRREGLPLSALESLSAGRPVFASGGVVQAFGGDVPMGIRKVRLSPRAMRRQLIRANVDEEIRLPIDYQAEVSALRYLVLFETMTQAWRE